MTVTGSPFDTGRRGNGGRRFAVESGLRSSAYLVQPWPQRAEPPGEHRLGERSQVVEGGDRLDGQAFVGSERELARQAADAPGHGRDENPLHHLVGCIPAHDEEWPALLVRGLTPPHLTAPWTCTSRKKPRRSPLEIT